MRGTILITNGDPDAGPDHVPSHPPEDWAQATADQIVDIAETCPEALAAEGRKFRTELVGLLGRYFAKAQQHERAALKEHSHARLTHDLDPARHAKEPVGAIVSLASGYSFEEHFQKPEIQDYIRRVLEKDMGSVMLIERSWHADKNSHTKEAKAFRATHHPQTEAPKGGGKA